MKQIAILLALSSSLALAAAACKGGETTLDRKAELRLTRTGDGRIAVELLRAPDRVRAIQVELSVDGGAAFTLEEAKSPDGLPLDSVRMAMRGANRAILFAGDKRGILLPRSGAFATLAARSSGGDASGSSLRIASAVVVAEDGARVDTVLGPSLALR